MNIDDKSQYFATPRKHNHSATESSTSNNIYNQVKLVLYPMQYQINTTTNMKHQKIPPNKNEYVCFQTY